MASAVWEVANSESSTKWELRTVPLTEKYVVIMLPVTADKQTEPPDSGVAEAAGGQNTML